MATGQATERQQEVLDLIEQGKTVKEIASALRIGEQGVRSHIKRLKQRGLVSKSYASNGRGRRGNTRSNRRTTVATSGNGRTSTASGSGHSTGSITLDGIPALETAWQQMETRRTDIREEVGSIESRLEELATEQTTLNERASALADEAERLQRVEEAVAGAVA